MQLDQQNSHRARVLNRIHVVGEHLGQHHQLQEEERPRDLRAQIPGYCWHAVLLFFFFPFGESVSVFDELALTREGKKVWTFLRDTRACAALPGQPGALCLFRDSVICKTFVSSCMKTQHHPFGE